MVCSGCLMSDRGAPNTSQTYTEECWALTDLMAEGGALLIGLDEDMNRSRNRLKTKVSTDGPGEYSGPPVTNFSDCSMKQKRLVLYHKLYRFLYGIGRTGVRIALPACCILRIQLTYSDPKIPATIDEGFVEDTFDNGLDDEEIQSLKRKYIDII